MTVPVQQYYPVGTQVVGMAVTTTLTSGVPSAVQITLHSREVLATPATFVTDNSLQPEVLSRAGLPEDSTLSDYALAASSTEGIDYVYVLTATVTAA